MPGFGCLQKTHTWQHTYPRQLSFPIFGFQQLCLRLSLFNHDLVRQGWLHGVAYAVFCGSDFAVHIFQRLRDLVVVPLCLAIVFQRLLAIEILCVLASRFCFSLPRTSASSLVEFLHFAARGTSLASPSCGTLPTLRPCKAILCRTFCFSTSRAVGQFSQSLCPWSLRPRCRLRGLLWGQAVCVLFHH